MEDKKELISGIIFWIYFSMMLIFIPMVFFYGQIIGGSIYFMCFALTLAYFLLDLKFEFAFKKFYRFFIYINDVINILAVAVFIYYEIYIAITIPLLVIVSLSLLFDMICRDRLRSKNKANVTANVAGLMVMISIFPYFFFRRIDFIIILIGIVFAFATFVCKVYLTVYSYANELKKEAKEKKSELEKVIESMPQDNILE